MKQKILNELKTKYSHLGLSNEYLTSLAEALSATGLVTDDNLATVIEGQEESLKKQQSESDKTRTKIKALEDELKLLKGKHTEEQGKENKSDVAIPEWFSNYQKDLEAIKKAQEESAKASKAIEDEKAKSERDTAIKAKAKELGISEGRIKQGFVIAQDADDATINSYLSDVRKYEVSAGLEKQSGFVLSSSDEAIKQEAENWAKQL